jgi:hypothetical protein
VVARNTTPSAVESSTVTSCRRTPCDPANSRPVELRNSVVPLRVPVAPRANPIAGSPALSPIGGLPRSLIVASAASSLPRPETLM